MRVRYFTGRKIKGDTKTVPDLTTSLRQSLETMTVEPSVGYVDDYNGDIDDNPDLDFEDDLTDIDRLQDYAREKQSNVLNNLNYEIDEEGDPTAAGAKPPQSGNNPTE